MAVTESNRIDEGGRVRHYASGKFVDDAVSPPALTLTLGFRPSNFRILDLTNRVEFEWQDGFAATNTLKTVAAGTRTLDTTSAIVVSAATPGPTSYGLVNSPVGEQPTYTVTIAAAAILQNAQNYWTATA